MKRNSRNFSISLTPEVLTHVDQRAEASGLNRSAYIESVLTRAFAKDDGLPPEIPVVFRVKDPRNRKHKRPGRAL